jgi:cytochrome c oxidase subunit 2
MYSNVVFEADKLGEGHVFCAEYCGTSHSAMMAEVVIMTPEQWDEYMKKGPPPPPGKTPAEWGEMLFNQNGCTTCHSRDGSKSPGPTFKGVFGRHEQMSTGNYIDIDDAYVQESIRKPQAKIVMGYNNVIMPTFSLSDRQIDALIAYLKTIK